MIGNRAFKSFNIMLSMVLFFSIVSPLFNVNAAEDNKRYIPAGIPIGLNVDFEGINVTGYGEIPGIKNKDNPAVKSGILPGDMIIAINGKKISTTSEFSQELKSSAGRRINLTVNRSGTEHNIAISAVKCNDGTYRLGINVKDSIAGIGTITYISADDGSFGGLGHGICDVQTGNVIPITKGTVCDVLINKIIKGETGVPGEIRGVFSINRTGTLIKNTDRGIFGYFNDYKSIDTQAVELAKKNEIRCGEAELICTLDSTGPQRYSVMIEESNLDSGTKTRNFVVRVTDADLLNKTGGIIQGMSGSPIIQNGKLVGAVTHVLVNDPTRGYGIFIENMLETENQVAEEQAKKDAS